ncbi:MAG TPA: AtzH-like domain-containing protein [Pyrinomonadaceae bacterium]|nr:AtzH-like domain-containing protein [Pyrinomonadaceae bacterium]
MLKRFFCCLALALVAATAVVAQEETTTPTPKPTPRAAGRQRGAGGQDDPTKTDVLSAFDALVKGIEAANVDAVTGAYWNSPQLVLYNNNGTVTRGWEQMRTNRQSSYAKLKDVKLEVRDKRVQMLGRDGAVVSFLWTQSQTYDGTPDTATGRTTLVFRRIGKQWKVVHAHISPDSPDQSRVPSAERTTTTTPAPTPKPTP